MMNESLLRLTGVHKSFPGVLALNDINLEIKKGEVHALIGENGAGKSTLVKVLTGVYRKDSGKIFLNDQEINPKNLLEAQEFGISVILQELNLISNLSISANMFIGSEVTGKLGFLNEKSMEKECSRFLDKVGLDLHPSTRVKFLNPGQLQLVEIARALSRKSKIIIMDEPTSSLSERETHTLFDIINTLKQKEVSILYISHYIDEVFQIADRITILRDAKLIDTVEKNKSEMNDVIKKMVGTNLNVLYKKDSKPKDLSTLSVKNLTKHDNFENVYFDIKKGEIFGITGLIGAGKSELAWSIFGLSSYDTGEIYLDGKRCRINSPMDGIKHGIGMVTEDRHKYGLVLLLSVLKNISLVSMHEIQRMSFIVNKKELNLAMKFVKSLRIKSSNIHQSVRYLSGGNQQKVVLAKWLAKKPTLLILDEPTRGIDIGAKREIYDILNNLAKRGTSILFISSDFQEIVEMTDRLIVMRNGRIVARIDHSEASKEDVVKYATGGYSVNEEIQHKP
jgi:ribose transport system ATP-binding protein